MKLNRSWSDFALTQRRDDFRHDWTDEYNLGGFGALVPSAPYSGSAEGPGFLLENIPDSRTLNEVLTGSETAVISNAVATRFRADHSTISFGPTLKRQLTEAWSVEAGVGISLHWLHWSASQHEKLTVSKGATRTVINHWEDSSSGNTMLSALYLQVATEWQPKQQDWALKALLRGDLGESFSMTVGPSRLGYEVDGFTAAVMVTFAL